MQRAAPVVCSTLCHPVSISSCSFLFFFLCKLYIAELTARLSLWTKLSSSQFCSDSLTQSSCLEQMCRRILGWSPRHFKNFRTEQTLTLSFSLLLFPTLLAKWLSCLSEESLELVNLRVSCAPHGPQPALL